MKSKLATAFAALMVLAGCNTATEYKISDFDRNRTIYFYSVTGLPPIRMHGQVVLDMPDGRSIALKDYRAVPTDKHFGENVIVPGIE